VLKLELAESGRLKLLRAGLAQHGAVTAEKVETDLREGHAIYGGEFHLQQNLPRFWRGRNLQEIDDRLGARLGQAGGSLGLLRALHAARQYDGFAMTGDVDR